MSRQAGYVARQNCTYQACRECSVPAEVVQVCAVAQVGWERRFDRGCGARSAQGRRLRHLADCAERVLTTCLIACQQRYSDGVWKLRPVSLRLPERHSMEI